jgi:asparagine synthase (glutamine-hydrolysing)
VVSGYKTYGPAPGALSHGLEVALDLRGHLREEYARGAAEVEYPESAGTDERRLRLVSYLYLTRALRVILTRTGRLSSAAGLQLRTPFADARLIDYAYNIPWSIKNFDRREKSVLRASARELLPASIIYRQKTAYPSIRHPSYSVVLQQQAAQLAADTGHPVFAIVKREWLRNIAHRETAVLAPRERNMIEWILNLATWLLLYRPTLRLP